MIISISYPLTLTSPLYPGTPEITSKLFKSLQRGDKTNTSLITLNTHSGTHLDVPYHFCVGGTTVQDHFKKQNTFYPTYCIDFPVLEPTQIDINKLKNLISLFQDAEALLIRTGWWKKRENAPYIYCNTHPWISPDVSDLLREKCSKLKIFGIDLISVSSPSQRKQGHECHRRFLCTKPPILILEDIDLQDPKVIRGKYILHLYPYVIDALDGIPVIAILERENNKRKIDSIKN